MTASPNKDRNATSPLSLAAYIFVFLLGEYTNMAAFKNNDCIVY